MRVVCENCGATYKIPESKLTKEVNKATCRKCNFRMMIRRPAASVSTSNELSSGSENAATQVTANPLDQQGAERELLEAKTQIQKEIVAEWSDEAPTQVQSDPLSAASKSGKPRPASSTNAAKAPGDMLLALVATFGAAAGPMLLATNTGDVAVQRMAGLLLGLWGALTCLFLLITGNLWRQQGNVPISVALATVLSLGGTAFVEVAMYDSSVSTPPQHTAPAPPPIETEPEKKATEATDTGVPAVAEAPDEPEAPAPEREEAPPPPAEIPEPSPEPDFEEELDEPDIDDIPAATRSDAEERRRKEMEEAAARARADREAREAERARKEKEAEAERGPPKMKSLPLTVVDTMIRSNMSVKRCFFNEKEANGRLPARVNVRFTVMPAGRVSTARVTTAEYKGSSLDSCLGRAFKAITFPAFEGEPLSMTYPFIL